LQELAVELDSLARDTLVQFVVLLNKWNKAYNLTALKNPDEMIGRHILDSLSVLPWMPNAVAAKESQVDVLDVGSGGGLPCIPLAIARPDLRFLSVESVGKKTRFQQQAKQELSIDNLSVAQKRISDVDISARCIVSRAFTAPNDFLTAVHPHSVMLGQKERLPEKLTCGFELSQIEQLSVPQCDSTRHVAICHKS